jgi:hypothetical protein
MNRKVYSSIVFFVSHGDGYPTTSKFTSQPNACCLC